MKIGIQAEFKFHPVGHGCFYTGKITYNQKGDFSFVYDCGAMTNTCYLNVAIDTYKQKLPEQGIDLLIISHFDKDHVNGISKLLNKIKCKRLVIPYYKPIERLLLYTSYNRGGEEYRQMMQNPIDYFTRNFDIDEIVLVGLPDDVIIVPNLTDNSPDEQGDSGRQGNPSPFQNDGFYSGINKENIRLKLEDTEVYLPDEKKTKLHFLDEKQMIYIKFWEFKFYLEKMHNNLLIENFTKSIESYCDAKKKIVDLFKQDLMKEIKSIYRQYFKGSVKMNQTSIVICHGPTKNFNIPSVFYTGDVQDNSTDLISCRGTLLTGDISLKLNKNSSNQISDYFKRELEKILVFQVPHHGSANNWIFSSDMWFKNFRYYVINQSRTPKTSSTEVEDDINKYCSKAYIKINNEDEPFEYKMWFNKIKLNFPK